MASAGVQPGELAGGATPSVQDSEADPARLPGVQARDAIASSASQSKDSLVDASQAETPQGKAAASNDIEAQGEPLSVKSVEQLASYGLPNRGRGYKEVELHQWVTSKGLHHGGLRTPTLLDAISQANFREINLAFSGQEDAKPTDAQMRRAMVKWVLAQLKDFNASGKLKQADSLDDLPAIMWRSLSQTKGQRTDLRPDEQTNVFMHLQGQLDDFIALPLVQQVHLAAFLDRNHWPKQCLGRFAMKIIAMMTDLSVTQLVTLKNDNYKMREFEFEPVVSSLKSDDGGALNRQQQHPLMLALSESNRWSVILRDAVDPPKSTEHKDDGRILHLGKSIAEALGFEVEIPNIRGGGDCLYDSLARMPHIQQALREAEPVKKASLFRKLGSSAAPALTDEPPTAMEVRQELARRAIEWLSEQELPDLDDPKLSPEAREEAHTKAQLAANEKGPEAELALRCSVLAEYATHRGSAATLNVAAWKGTLVEKKFEALRPAQKRHIRNLLAGGSFDNETTDLAPQLAAWLFKCELQVFHSGHAVQQGERIPLLTESRLGRPQVEGAPPLPRGILALDSEHYQPVFAKDDGKPGALT